MTATFASIFFTRYYFHQVRKRMSEWFREAAKNLGYDRLKPEQERVLSEFMSGKDVFVTLPTGYESLCYAALAPAFHLKKFRSIELKQSIVLVCFMSLKLWIENIFCTRSQTLTSSPKTRSTYPVFQVASLSTLTTSGCLKGLRDVYQWHQKAQECHIHDSEVLRQ